MARNKNHDKFWHRYFKNSPDPTYEVLAPLDSTQPLLLSQMITPSGGSRITPRRLDWLSLVRIWKLNQRRFSRS